MIYIYSGTTKQNKKDWLQIEWYFNFQAGLATADTADRLLIALEPEAAAIFCRKLRLRDCVWGYEPRKKSNNTLFGAESQVADEFSGNLHQVC